MNRLIPSSGSNPCPICDDATGKCRHGSRGDGYVLCMSFAGASTAPPGYRYIGDTKDGLWGQFVESLEKDDRHRQDWEARRAERQRQGEERRQKELFELARALPVDERSAQNRKFLLGLDLDGDHLENLKARGLNDRQIRSGLYKSIAPRQPLKSPISPRLAGIVRNGKSAWVSGRGILCPAFDVSGRVIGMQLRLDDGGDGGKYRWLKSQFGSKLPNGEMPLTVVKPEGEVRRIGLCEGIMKPAVAATLSGDTLFIGASGGNFKASRQQLEEALRWARREYGEKPVAFYPDAGALQNPQVTRRDRTTLQLLEKLGRQLGFEPEVAHWGQGFDKEARDIDELLAAGCGDEIEFLKPPQYHRPTPKAGCGSEIEFLKTPQYHRPTPKANRQHSARISPREWFEKFGVPNAKDYIKEEIEGILLDASLRAVRGDEISTGPAPERPNRSDNPEPNAPQNKQKNARVGTGAIVLARLAARYEPELASEGRFANQPAIRWASGKALPSREEWMAMGRPVVLFEEKDAAGFFKALDVQAPWIKNVLDSSSCGSGKSYRAGNYEPPNPEGRVWFVLESPHNPTTETVELRSAKMPDKNEGKVIERTRFTPSGNPYQRTPKEGEQPHTTPTCDCANIFHRGNEKGFSLPAGKDSPICGQCPKQQICQTSGYLYQKKKINDFARRIRLHASQLTGVRNSDTVVVDEARSLQPTRTIEVTREQIAAIVLELRRFDPRVAAIFAPLLEALVQRCEDSLKGENHHGFTNVDLTELDGENIRARVREAFGTDENLLPYIANAYREFHQAQLNLSGCHTYEQKRAVVERAIPNFFEPLLRFLDGSRAGLTVRYGKVTIHRPNYALRKQLRAASRTILLDGTISIADAASSLGVDCPEIVQVCQIPKTFSNLTIKVIDGLGDCKRERRYGESEGEKPNAIYQGDRVVGFTKALARYGGRRTGVIDFLKHEKHHQPHVCKTGHWGNENRGSNEFVRCDRLVAYGKPYPNLGDLAATYTALTGRQASPGNPSGGFAAYIQRRMREEVIQCAGRPRADRRRDDAIEVILAANWGEREIEAIASHYPGCKLERVDVTEIAPQCAEVKVATRWGVKRELTRFLKRGIVPKLNQLSDAARTSASTVSRALKELFEQGWVKARNFFHSVIETFKLSENSTAQLLESLDEGALWLIREYLPDIIDNGSPEELAEVLMVYADGDRRLYEMAMGLQSPRRKALALIKLYVAAFGDAIAPDDPLMRIPIAAQYG